MRKTLLDLDPERDKIFWTAVSAALKKLRRRPEHAKTPWAQLEVESLLAACNGSNGGQRVPTLFVLADIDTLRSGLHANSICETDDGTPLPVEVCAAWPATPRSSPSSSTAAAKPSGRTLATPGDTGAASGIAAMHRTCIDPTCTVPFEDCQIHHIIAWEQGGPTDLSNLAPLCTADHHLVHEGGWTLTMTPDRSPPGPDPTAPSTTPAPPSTAHPTASPHPGDQLPLAS